MIEKFARAFPLWVTVGSLVALIHPPVFSWFITGGYVTPALQVIMLAMGLTLRAEDFRAVAGQKALVFLGVLLQFTVMPGVGFVVGKLLRLPEPLFAGLVLVCCCPGGTASNVIAFLAKADVALSVAMTACSTLCAALVTPTLTTLFLDQAVRVDVAELYVTTAKVVLLPVIVGGALRRYAGQVLAPMLSALPALAVVAIVFIVAGIIGVQRDMVLESGPLALLAVTLVHGLAFLFSYLIAKGLRANSSAQRTISIEVGMQNSGLGVVLARASFSDPLVSVTPALSAIVHCLYGSALAAWWGRGRPEE